MGNTSLIWQPKRLRGDPSFKILLDRGFAREMADYEISQETQTRMNELGSEEIGKDNIPLYSFYENSCLISQINLGCGGTWLAASGIENLVEKEEEEGGHIEYNTHNVDYLRDRYQLLSLFEMWVDYSDILRDVANS